MKHTQFYAVLMMLLFPVIGFSQRVLIVGKVTDQETRQPLSGTLISVLETGNGVAAELDGRYQVTVSPGTYHLIFSYTGFQADTILLQNLQDGATIEQNIRLKVINELNEVIVGGKSTALNQQKSADNIKNVVSAEQIGRFPDPNVAEALQRVPGVNIERDQGEGRYVLVRGLAPKFTNVSINGEQISSPEAGVRYVALDAIPADQLASMEISKSLLPDMDGDAIGGSVNLITRKALDSLWRISASVAGGYNALMNKPNIQGSLQLGKRFGKREQFGLMLNLTHYHNDLGSDNWERDLNGTKEPEDDVLELRDYQLTRTRSSASATLDYRFNRNNEIYFRGMYNRFTDREWRRLYAFAPEDGEVERELKDRFEEQVISSFNLGGKHIFPKMRVDYEAAYSYSFQNTPYDYAVNFAANVPSSVDFRGTDFPALSSTTYLDNSLYQFDQFEAGNTFAKDQNITGKINITVPYFIGTSKGELKFGGKVRLKQKSFDIEQNIYEGMGNVPTLNAFEGGLLDDNYFGGRFELARAVNMPTFVDYFNNNPAQFELQIEDKAIDEALESYEAKENVYAGYLMTRQTIKRLTLIGGVRYEYSAVSYNSSDVVIAPNGDLRAILPVKGSTNYGYILPQLQARYAVNRTTNLRGALTWSYARPNFDEIIPAQEANLEDGEVSIGNPNLLPVSAINADLMYEKYFGDVGIVSAGVFFKQLDGFIYNRTDFNQPYLNDPSVLVDITQAQNGNTANLFGVELAFQKSLDFLPKKLKGFSVYGNYTFTTSQASIQNRSEDAAAGSFENINLPGQTTHLGNAALMYERKGFFVRAALNFNGSYLSEVGSTADYDLYVQKRMQFDCSLGYTIKKKYRVFAEFMNLTNQPFESYMGTKETIVQREFYGFWMRAGLKFDLR
ncbi:TonB-dependent receptor [Fluviicola sp.]|uniref:TonB-dependent receptor n=1 Tax=Fluviicola sp. TaxID=1917219 RepID=UPI003D2BDF29